MAGSQLSLEVEVDELESLDESVEPVLSVLLVDSGVAVGSGL